MSIKIGRRLRMLLDQLESHPAGVNTDEILADQGWDFASRGRVYTLVSTLRKWLATQDRTIAKDRPGIRGIPHTYRIETIKVGMDATMDEQLANVISRLTVVRAEVKSLYNAVPNKRSREARNLNKLHHAVELVILEAEDMTT